MQTYQASCHCGAVAFTFKGPAIDRGLRCNCSLCRRKGAMMTPFTFPPSDLEVAAHEEALTLYEFGTGVAKHYFCRHCGVYTFHETRRQPGHFRANIGCVEGVDPFNLPCEVFDGAAL